MMYDHQDTTVIAPMASRKPRHDTRISNGQQPGTLDRAGLHYDRDRWMFDTILDMVETQTSDRSESYPSATISIGALSHANPCAPVPRNQENFAATLCLAVNAALSGSPRGLERLLPSDPTTERLLCARGAANEMAREPARLYLRHLYSAILTLAAARETITRSGQQRPLTPLPKWRFARVKEYVDSHIDEPIRLRDLANAAGLSQMHFAAQFRAYTGISPCKFVMTQRMQHARLLLADPRNTLVDVALGVGFRNQAHFTTVFHRLVGQTPNCWRNARNRESIQEIQ
jgi:AraC-like DNA-binding protein